MTEVLKNFWVLEGLDGSGTTTQLELLSSYFESIGKKVFITCEPTKNPTGQLLRSILSGQLIASSTTTAHMFAADRDDHLSNPEYGIKKHIECGETVLCDRYFFSSYAYQGTDVDFSLIGNLNSSFPYPQGVIFIDTPPKECIRRIESRGLEKEIYERYSTLVHVRENYFRCFSSLPGTCRLITIDGMQSKERVFSEIIQLFV